MPYATSVASEITGDGVLISAQGVSPLEMGSPNEHHRSPVPYATSVASCNKCGQRDHWRWSIDLSSRGESSENQPTNEGVNLGIFWGHRPRSRIEYGRSTFSWEYSSPDVHV